MNNLFNIFLVLFLFYIILFSRKETFEESNISYYIDKTGKHTIQELPLELTDILELKYINTKKDRIKFLLTKGSYKHSESKNEMKILNGKSEKYQFIFLKNDSPFSGILF
jgi:hypothetical protein